MYSQVPGPFQPSKVSAKSQEMLFEAGSSLFSQFMPDISPIAWLGDIVGDIPHTPINMMTLSADQTSSNLPQDLVIIGAISNIALFAWRLAMSNQRHCRRESGQAGGTDGTASNVSVADQMGIECFDCVEDSPAFPSRALELVGHFVEVVHRFKERGWPDTCRLSAQMGILLGGKGRSGGNPSISTVIVSIRWLKR